MRHAASSPDRNDTSREWRHVLHTSGATLAAVLVALASTMLSTRALGPSGRGTYAAATAWVGLFSVLGSLSLGQVIVHRVAGQPREAWAADIVGTGLAIALAAGVVGWLMCAALYAGTGGRLFGYVPPGVMALAFLGLPPLIWGDTARLLLGALDAVRVANWAQLAGAGATLAALAVGVGFLGGGVRAAGAATSIGAMTAGGLMLAGVLRRAPAPRVRPRLGLALLRACGQLHPTAVGNYLYAQATVLVLNYYRPGAETAFYQMAVQMFSTALLLSTAVSTVAFSLVAQRGPDAAWPAQRRLVFRAVGVVGACAVAGYAAAPLAVRVLAGERFLPAVGLFRMMLPALVGATLSTAMASQWIGRGLFRQAAGLTAVVGVVSLATDLALVPRRGMYGAVVSTLVTYGISVVANGGMMVWVQGRWRAWAASHAVTLTPGESVG